MNHFLPQACRRLLFITLLIGSAFRVAADDPPAGPSAGAKAAVEEIQKAGAELNDVLGPAGYGSFASEALRKEVAPKAIPVVRRILGAGEKLATAEPRAKDNVVAARPFYLSILSTLGDADASKELADTAKSPGEPGLQAQMGLLVTQWWLKSGDAVTQAKIADQAVALFKANPENEGLADSILRISHTGQTNAQLRDTLEQGLLDNVKGGSKEFITALITSVRKMRALEGKPITLAGTTLDGHPFTTADWKGKVVLVDFWATWCPQCMAELPRVEKLYQQYHGKGLEVVGVNSDEEVRMLKGFLSEDKDVVWPQLFEPSANGSLHPLAKQYGIEQLPVMFLIDQKGILRSAAAQEDYLIAVPKLLAE